MTVETVLDKFSELCQKSSDLVDAQSLQTRINELSAQSKTDSKPGNRLSSKQISQLLDQGVKMGKDPSGVTRPIAYLADFDQSTRKLGFDGSIPRGSHFPLWDPTLNAHQISSDCVDRFAMTWMLLDFTFQDELKSLNNLALLRKLTSQITTKKKTVKPKLYWPREGGAWKSLHPLKGEVWSAFCTTCLESKLLTSQLRKTVQLIPGSVTAGDVKTCQQLVRHEMRDASVPRYDMAAILSLINQLLTLKGNDSAT